MVKSLESIYETERETLKGISHTLVYVSIYSITLKMSTSSHEIHCTYKMLHQKQTNQINNAGLFQTICLH